MHLSLWSSVGACFSRAGQGFLIENHWVSNRRNRRLRWPLLGEGLAGGHVAAESQGDRVEELEVRRVPVAA